MPVEREHERPLPAGLKALAHRGFQQTDSVSAGERGNKHEVLRAGDVGLDAVKVRAARSRCEKLHIHVAVLTRKHFRSHMIGTAERTLLTATPRNAMSERFIIDAV